MFAGSTSILRLRPASRGGDGGATGLATGESHTGDCGEADGRTGQSSCKLDGVGGKGGWSSNAGKLIPKAAICASRSELGVLKNKSESNPGAFKKPNKASSEISGSSFEGGKLNEPSAEISRSGCGNKGAGAADSWLNSRGSSENDADTESSGALNSRSNATDSDEPVVHIPMGKSVSSQSRAAYSSEQSKREEIETHDEGAGAVS